MRWPPLCTVSGLNSLYVVYIERRIKSVSCLCSDLAKVSGADLRDASHEQAVEAIRRAGDTVDFLVQSGHHIPQVLYLQLNRIELNRADLLFAKVQYISVPAHWKYSVWSLLNEEKEAIKAI